jgi:DNA-binding Lrp family transcriptional regulator
VQDWRILAEFYKAADWEWKAISIQEIMEKEHMSRKKAQYRLDRLTEAGLIRRGETYPLFYYPLKSHELRKQIESHFKNTITSMLHAGEGTQ